MEKERNQVTWFKREASDNSNPRVDSTVSSSLHAYIMTQLVVLQSICSHGLFNSTGLWSTGTGLGTGWKQHIKDLVAGLWALVVQKGRHV